MFVENQFGRENSNVVADKKPRQVDTDRLPKIGREL